MNRIRFAAVWLLMGVGVASSTTKECFAADEADSRIRIQHDRESFVTTITVQASNGRVAWADVVRGFAQARGHDDAALRGVLPDQRFELTGIGFQLALAGINLALSPNIEFHVQQATTAGGEPELVIKLDREALLASRRRFKGWLRNAWTRIAPDKQQFGLQLDDGWERRPATLNLAVFVHGLNSRPEAFDGMIGSARRQGLPCATFNYPNDQAIGDSAKLLASQLAEVARAYPRRGVSLVTHSMGALVSRAVIETPALDPGNVRRLIMVAPPNHGSGLARFSFGLELWEQIGNQRRREDAGKSYAWIEDGLSEAAADLQPDSIFLQRLNARPRNPKVRYSIFLGTDGPLSEAELTALRRKVAAEGNRNRWVRFFGANADRWLAELDEVVRGKGDGAVSVKRGRLQGVEDTVVLRFDHVGVLASSPQADAAKVQQEVLRRLRQ